MKKYKALETTSTIFEVMGYIIALVGFFVVIYLLGTNDFIYALLVILSAFLLTLSHLFISQMIKLFIDIEENSRVIISKLSTSSGKEENNAATDNASNTIFCTNCGMENAADASNCKSCNQKL
ncbi:MAG: hypothetical protein M0Q12_14040 [Synergistaceae bacterium]|jgi:hypothetical protein|nr:hypothetical protein [Synergistaceae bacterium]